MTIEELQIAKELYDKKNVERSASIHKDIDNTDNILDGTDNSRDKIQYQAALTDPRRI